MRTEARDNIPRHVIDALVEGCQVIGFDWTYLYLNDAAAAQGRRDKAQLLGRTMMECYPGIDQTSMFSTLRRCMTERTHDRLENEFTFPDGSRGWFELRFIPVPEGVCILSLDITERKRAEEALVRANESMRLLIDGVADHAIFLIDPRGRVASWNAGAERLHGDTAEEALDADFGRFFVSEDRARETPRALLDAALADGRTEDEGWRRRKDGTPFWANVVITRLEDSGGTHVGFAAVTRDLTERRRLEEQIRQAQKMEAVGRLAGGVAHDFNNILSVIFSYSAISLGGLAPGDPLREDLEEIQAAARRASELTSRLLSFTRNQVVQPQLVDLRVTIAGMRQMLQRLLGEDIELRYAADDALWKVVADRTQLEQIVLNLAVNARDAMPDGGLLTIEMRNVDLDEDHARTHLETSPGPHVLLAVTDTGIGMDRATQERIFEPFFTTKEPDKGTGLGLSTVFGIVKQCRGSIWVYSEPGHGTTFKIYLPRAEAVAQAAEARPARAAAVGGTETILVVEDDDQVRAVVRTIHTKNGYRVSEARSGAEALDVCERHEGPIHLLLTDMVMPRMSGRELAERLTALRPEIRILFMSGYTEGAFVHRGPWDPGLHLLQKPITPDRLLAKVREVLGTVPDGPSST